MPSRGHAHAIKGGLWAGRAPGRPPARRSPCPAPLGRRAPVHGIGQHDRPVCAPQEGLPRVPHERQQQLGQQVGVARLPHCSNAIDRGGDPRQRVRGRNGGAPPHSSAHSRGATGGWGAPHKAPAPAPHRQQVPPAPRQSMQPVLAWARARPLHFAAALLLGPPAAFLAAPLLVSIAFFAAPVLVPALLFCAVSALGGIGVLAAAGAGPDAPGDTWKPPTNRAGPLQALWWLTDALPPEAPAAAASAAAAEGERGCWWAGVDRQLSNPRAGCKTHSCTPSGCWTNGVITARTPPTHVLAVWPTLCRRAPAYCGSNPHRASCSRTSCDCGGSGCGSP